MCHVITLIVPTDDADAVRVVMDRHGRAATTIDNPSVRKALGDDDSPRDRRSAEGPNGGGGGSLELWTSVPRDLGDEHFDFFRPATLARNGA